VNPNRVQLLFFLGILAILLHFTILCSKEIFQYTSLNKEAPAHIHQWETIPLKNKFAIKADFSFEADGKAWPGSFTFPELYLNEWAALGDLKKKAKKPWISYYYTPYEPVLEKNFPTSTLFKTAICYGTLAYFLLLRRKMAKIS
jgi:hypothetical protein